MTYKNDSFIVIADKYGATRMDAIAELYETYDKLRDLTVTGPAFTGDGYGPTASFFMNLAKLVAPGSFMPFMGGTQMNIPGSSYSSAISGGNTIVPGGSGSFGYGNLGNYPGWPSGGAAAITGLGSIGSLLMGIGNSTSSLSEGYTIGGNPTGGAASMVGVTNAAGAVSGIAAGYGTGSGLLMSTAGVISGLGGLVSSLGPYFGPYGVAASIVGNMATGYGGALISGMQYTRSKIINNADIVLSNKVKNIETLVKQIDVQTEVVRKMLKDQIESESKVIQNIS